MHFGKVALAGAPRQIESGRPPATPRRGVTLIAAVFPRGSYNQKNMAKKTVSLGSKKMSSSGSKKNKRSSGPRRDLQASRRYSKNLVESDEDSDELLSKIAHAALIDGVSYAALAAANSCSISQIARWVNRARQRGIAEVYVYPSSRAELENQLNSLYKLEYSRVVPTEETVRKQMEMLGRHAAILLDRLLDGPGLKHCLCTGGLSQFHTMRQIEDRKRDVEFWPTALHGRGPDYQKDVHIAPPTNMTLAWTRCGEIENRFPHGVTVPPYLDSVRKKITEKSESGHPLPFATRLEIAQQAVAEIENEWYVKNFLEEQDKILPHVAILGTGSIEKDAQDRAKAPSLTVLQLLDGIVSWEEMQQESAAAELGYCFYDDKGQYLPKLKFFCGASHERLRRMRDARRSVVLVSGCAERAKAIRSVLMSKLISHLVIDFATAQLVLGTVTR